jgi:hypothetical protein
MVNLTKEELQKLKNVSHREYLYGDFDHDGVKNVDDPKPFDQKIKHWPKHNDNPGYYHRAQYGGGEIKLSDELMAIEKHNNQQAPLLQRFLKENPGSYGRVKTVPSTMKKLRERYLSNVHDIAAASVATKDRKEAYAKTAQIRQRYSSDPKENDDYYKNPKGGVHYALHTGIIDRNRRLEVQVKSKAFANLDKEMHPFYKRGNIPASFQKRAKTLFRMGF